MEFIRPEQIEEALETLRTSALPAAQARAKRVYMDEMCKPVKSMIMQEHQDKPLGAQEREALADPRYRETHLRGLQQAVYEDELQRNLRADAVALIEAWRTQCSNERAMKL